ncbi:uncharacterized protein LOC116031842 [Ipomoea triloba]|uniref:uncharacterized protein LOC116031842 n=1 Tax=Ipomoea triloba TaxID=35885 RepID=UPI00125E1619|nr:uncharacterized protein LOC116031842 [Ipomoea triloba]
MAAPAGDGGVQRLTERWADMVLDDETEGFEPVLDNGDAQSEGAKTWVVVGRFLTSKLVKVEFMRQVMASVWRPVMGVQISEVQPNLFMFVFYHESDMRYVLDEGPWSFENNTLVCRQLVDGVLSGDVLLDSVDMWVQVHDLPLGYTSDLVLEQVGNFLGTFVRCDDRFVGAPWRMFYRIRVVIPVGRPIQRRMNLVKRDKTASWVTFRYERLHTYCFFCGMLGHSYKFCLKARESNMPVEFYPYGAELRAGGFRGPRAVGEPWLIPLTGPPKSADETIGNMRQSVDNSSALVAEQQAAVSVVAVTKRLREGSGGGVRRNGGVPGDVVMSDVPKNLSSAGSGSQTRPSS